MNNINVKMIVMLRVKSPIFIIIINKKNNADYVDSDVDGEID